MNIETQNCEMEPIYECPKEQTCERVYYHDVQHIVPIHTNIVNHHIYRHSYTPCYTTSESSTCENVYDSCNKNFF